MKRTGFKRKGKEKPKPSKVAKKTNVLMNKQQRQAAYAEIANDANRAIAGPCPYVFPEHYSHASQPCTRHKGHLGPHHCGGVKK